MKVIVPEDTYILWMDFGAYGLTDEEIHHRIFGLAGVIGEEGTLFDPDHGQGFFWQCLGTQPAIEKKALERIAQQF